MLHLITGTQGSGKTAYAHRLLKEMVSAGERDMLLIVPEQFTHESELGVLNELGAAGACEVDVLSFERLAQRIFEKNSRPVLPALDECGRTVLMSLAVSEISDKLKVYTKHSDNPAFISGMLSLADEFKQCTVSAEDLLKVSRMMPEGVLSEKTAEAALIYETYEALSAQSFFDTADTLTRLYEIVCEKHSFEGKIAVLDGFRRFTGQELKIVEALMTQAKDVYVTFSADTLDISEGEANAFTSIKITAKRIIDCAKRHNVRISVPKVITDKEMGFSTYSDEALKYLEHNLYLPDADSFEGDGGCVTVCTAATVTDECAYVARTVKKLIREGFCRCRDISVVFRQDGVYERELKYALKKYGVAMFEDNRQPIANQPLICLVRSALCICSDGFDTETIMRYAKTSLSGLGTDEWSQLENYVLMWEIKGSDWLHDWSFNPDGFGCEMNVKRQERLDEINASRRMLVLPLEKLRSDCKDASGKKISELIYSFLIDSGVDKNLFALAKSLESSGEAALAIEQQQIWDLLMQILDQIACALGDRVIPVKKYAGLFELSINAKSLGRIPTGFDETFIGSATRIQRRMSQVVFAVGMNDGVFPLSASGGGLFTDNERLELERLQLEMAKNSRTHALDERYIVYNTLCSARKRLYISYSCADASGSKLKRSETVERVETLLPDCRKITAAAEDFEYIEADEPAFELLAKIWHDNTVLSESLREYFSNREDYSGKLKALERAADKKQFRLDSKSVAEELFGKNIRMSASKAETYESCPFRYFCQYGLKAQPRKTARLDPAQSGTVIHYVLEKILAEYGGKELSGLDDKKIKELVSKYLFQYADEFMGGLSDKDKRFTFLFDRLSRTLEVIILRLCLEFEKSMFEPCDFELEIGGDGPIKAYELPVDGGSLSVYGKIDRVDKMEHDGKTYIRVVDYKTGAKEFNLSDVMNGMNMQMLLYLLALWNGGKKYYNSEIVPAGVLYLPARFMPFDSERVDDESELYNRVLADGKMSGLLLEDAANISAVCGDNGMFVPIKAGKDGKYKGNLIDIGRLGKLKDRLDEILTSLARSLGRGDIAAKPVCGKNYDKTCEFCNYKSVCCHESDGEFRYISFFKHDECLEQLSKGDEDDGKSVDT